MAHRWHKYYEMKTAPEGPLPDGKDTGDPTYPGCEITEEKLRFVQAVERRQAEMRTKFLKYTDVLQVALDLGYRKFPATIPVGD